MSLSKKIRESFKFKTPGFLFPKTSYHMKMVAQKLACHHINDLRNIHGVHIAVCIPFVL